MSVPSTDLKSVSEQIKEKIQAQAAGLIPDEVYEKIVAHGVDTLLEKQTYKINPINNQQGHYSQLELLIFGEILDQAKKITKEYFENPEIKKSIFGDQSNNISEIVKETLAEKSDLILKNFMITMMGNAMMDSLQGVRNVMMQNGIPVRF